MSTEAKKNIESDLNNMKDVYHEFEEFLQKRKLKLYQDTTKTPDWVIKAQKNIETISTVKKRKSEDEEFEFEDYNECDVSNSFKEEYLDKWIPTNVVTNLAILNAKSMWNYYFCIEDFLIDAENMVKSAIKRCTNIISKAYVASIYEFILKLCSHSCTTFLAQLDIDFYEFYKSVSAVEQLQVNGEWIKQPMPRRGYFMINEYVPWSPDQPEILERMKTKLRGHCNGNECLSYENLGPLSLEDGTWKSNCPDRKQRIECDKIACGCKNKECKNRFITDHKAKKIGVDVQEIESWGIDWFTTRLITSIMPKNITNETAGKFVEVALIKALQQQKKFGWDINNSLNFIENDNGTFFTEFHKKMAMQLKKIVALNRNGINSFKVHSKGIGIVCMYPGGFKQNELINEYFGEVHPPWRWYEKQDVIKKGQYEKKISLDLPDFYNIMLEKHKFDPDGYDILVI